ncbi:S-glutathionyl-(chloro)hydroquinone reductase [Tulasnella sp. 424]|nr:S-glutathionyl-(chloro)hydroquinone reductase [Tulasnella sp. 424]KAG8962588.1 S-glutathionyl-(chloro)hydroquinone reductase [Tulasnella sp. 425]
MKLGSGADSQTFIPIMSAPPNTSQSPSTDTSAGKEGAPKPSVPPSFRYFIEKGGQFTPEKDRYHLYVAKSCPWAGRAMITRLLKGLESFVGLTIVTPYMTELGWAFKKADERRTDGVEDDPLYGSSHLRELYFKADPSYEGRFTVPVLWDKKTETIVNNESSEIIRIFNSAFNEFLPEDKASLDLYPEELRPDIDGVNEWVFSTVNGLLTYLFAGDFSRLIVPSASTAGVYKAGFATSQSAYEEAVRHLFASLDRLEGMLKDKAYLIGGRLTEADVRLFTTLVRFDPVYHGHFKCNIGSIRHDYPNLNQWMRRMYWLNPAFKDSTDFHHITTGYYGQKSNPTHIIPLGPLPPIEPL